MGLLNAIKYRSLETDDRAHLFSSLCEMLLISILFFLLVLFYSNTPFFFLLLSLCYSDLSILPMSIVFRAGVFFLFFNLTMTARFS